MVEPMRRTWPGRNRVGYVHPVAVDEGPISGDQTFYDDAVFVSEAEQSELRVAAARPAVGWDRQDSCVVGSLGPGPTKSVPAPVSENRMVRWNSRAFHASTSA